MSESTLQHKSCLEVFRTDMLKFLKFWLNNSKEKSEPFISFPIKEQIYLFTTRPVIHLEFTQESWQDAINELQTLLKAKGCLSDISGNFDLDTKQAVEEFQKQNALFPDGIVGPLTWAALYYPKLHRTDETRSSNFQDAVKNLQNILKQEGFYHKKLDGKFGRNTEIALKCFQGLYGLKADGVVDPLTWVVLLGIRQRPIDLEGFLIGFHISSAKFLCLGQQTLMVSCILLGIYFSPISGSEPTFVEALASAIGLTCVVPFLTDRLMLKSPIGARLPLLRYAPYVLIGIIWHPILKTLSALFG